MTYEALREAAARRGKNAKIMVLEYRSLVMRLAIFDADYRRHTEVTVTDCFHIDGSLRAGPCSLEVAAEKSDDRLVCELRAVDGTWRLRFGRIVRIEERDRPRTVVPNLG